MTEQKPADNQPDNLTTEVRALRTELARLNNHRFVRVHRSLFRLTAFQFLRGIAFGLGTVIGATILVSLLVYFLSTIELVPIIGDWATKVIEEIKAQK